MLTERLYYRDSHIFEFDAEAENAYGNALILDKTAFFPGGGGQNCDQGYINNIRVVKVFEKDGIIYHELERFCPAGTVHCTVDKETRFRRMQNHSGEHIVSGLVNAQYGLDNVGFHMSDVITIDFNGELSLKELLEIEKTANEAVRANLNVTASFPENFWELEYRSKLELTENVRIVEIDGIDRCACCAPHVSRTGEIGIIKILSCERHRGGTRLTMLCGLDALDYINKLQENITEISSSLSVPREKTAEAVERLKEERDGLKYSLTGMEKRLVFGLADRGNCVFENLSEAAQRELCNILMEKHGIAGVFSGGKYIIGSKTADLRLMAKEINQALKGRGGGKPGMIQGSYSATEEEIKEYFAHVSVNKV